MHAPGSRSARPLTVVVTDEIGRPVARAAVSFHLPEDGASGVFSNGMRTEVVTTDERGRVSVRSLRWNNTPGRVQMRIIASKEQVRAGIISFQYVADEASILAASRGRQGSAGPKREAKVSRGRGRWLAIVAAAVGGGTAAGILATRGGWGAAKPSSGAGLIVPVATIGQPTITVGKP